MRNASSVLLTALLLLAFGTVLGVAEEPSDKFAPKIKVPIGKETTYITQPLRPDGYPDYIAALNEFCSRGVTPETNAAVLLQQAFGPRFVVRPEFFKALGIDVQPEKGDYFQDPDVIIRQFVLAWPENERDAQCDVLDAEFDQALLYPWKAEEHPIVARWLLQNQKPLRLVLDATRYERKFFPVVPSGQPLNRIALEYDQRTRYVANALVTQAMLLAGQGDFDDAWQYLLACHRLSRLAAQGPRFLIEMLISEKIERMATVGDAALLHYAKLPPKRLSEMRTDIQSLPLLTRAIEALDYGERFMYLDMVLHAARGNAEVFDDHHGNGGKPLDTLSRAISQANVDWDVPLRVGNQWFDRMKQAANIADRRQRAAAVRAIDEQLLKLSERIKYPRQAAWDIFTGHGTDADLNQQVSDLFVVLLVPGVKRIAELQADEETMSLMDKTALALAAYRADHGEYPEKIELLVPKYLAAVLDDPHDPEGFKLQYRREGEAYVLWSVGRDGVDDNGRTADDHPAGDDVVLNPLPQRLKPK
jgi:hypothetical protein